MYSAQLTLLVGDEILAQRRIFGNFKRSRQATEFVGLHGLLKNFLAFRIVNRNGKGLTRELAGPIFVILRVTNPSLELHGLSGPVDGTIRDEERFCLVVFLVVVLCDPNSLKSKECQAVVGPTGDG